MGPLLGELELFLGSGHSRTLPGTSLLIWPTNHSCSNTKSLTLSLQRLPQNLLLSSLLSKKVRNLVQNLNRTVQPSEQSRALSPKRILSKPCLLVTELARCHMIRE